MTWTVVLHDEFDAEMSAFDVDVQAELLAHLRLLAVFGPALKRPHADTLKGSAFANMKELQFKAGGGVWRVAYAFSPDRNGVILVAGDKGGTNERRFYRNLIEKADARYRAYLRPGKTKP